MIHNLHILIHDPVPLELEVLAAREQLLIEAHRRGAHPDGEKLRDCLLCRLGY